MRTFGKLTRNGNSSTVVVPRLVMHQLGWREGEPIVHHVVRGKLIVSSMRAEVDRLEREDAELAVALDKVETA